MSRKLVLTIVGAFASLAVLLWILPKFWIGGSMGMSGHGWAAYIIGGVVTLGLSGGLFLLTFHSSRSGQDDIDRPEDRSS